MRHNRALLHALCTRQGFVRAVPQLRLTGDMCGLAHLGLSLGNGFGDDFVEAEVGSGGFFAPLEQQAVPGADGQGGNLGQGIWPRLKDDQQHPNGRCHLHQPAQGWNMECLTMNLEACLSVVNSWPMQKEMAETVICGAGLLPKGKPWVKHKE